MTCHVCGRSLTRRAELLYRSPKGAVWLCGRKACETAYQFNGATQSSDAAAVYSGERTTAAGPVDADLAQPFQMEVTL